MKMGKRMLNKNRNIFLILLFAGYWFCLCAESATTPINNFSEELKRSFDIQKTDDLEFALYVLQQGYEVCTIIEGINSTTASTFGISCGGCKHKILSPAEFAGFLCARKAQNQLDDFKKLLTSQDKEAVNQFMMDTANQKELKCPLCSKFVCWIKN